MHQLNDAFDRLRSYIPTYPSSEKTSKIQTLKLAIEYIRDLADLLRDTEGRHVYAGEDICLLPRRASALAGRGNPDSWMDDVATESLQQSRLSDEVVVSSRSIAQSYIQSCCFLIVASSTCLGQLLALSELCF